MTDGREKMWFRPHRYGYGASPSTWEGVVVVLIYVAAIAFVSWFGLNHLAAQQRFTFMLGSISVLTALLILIARAKTKGAWRWRWGDDD